MKKLSQNVNSTSEQNKEKMVWYQDHRGRNVIFSQTEKEGRMLQVGGKHESKSEAEILIACSGAKRKHFCVTVNVNAVWNWISATGKTAINSISIILAKGSYYCYMAVPDSTPQWFRAQVLGEGGIVVWTPALPLQGLVAMGKLLNLSVPQLPDLWNEDNDTHLL